MTAPGQLTGAVVVVAAGSGLRLGHPVPKAFVQVAGRSLLERSLTRFRGHPALVELVVVVPPGLRSEAAALVGGDRAVRVVAGGSTRQASVAAGLAVVGDVDVVLVHDAARPFVPRAVIDAVLAALRSGAAAAVPVVAVHDTIRRVDTSGALAGVVDRAELVAIQTPQGFRRSVLLEAHAAAAADGLPVTDDAALVELLGVQVVAVPGAEESFKITTAADLIRADAQARLEFPALPSAADGRVAADERIRSR